MRRIKKTNIVNSIGACCRVNATFRKVPLRAFAKPSHIFPTRVVGILAALLALTCGTAGLTWPRAVFAYDPLEFVPDQVAAARLYGSAVMRRYGRPEYGIKLFVDLGTFSADDLSRESFALDLEFKNARSADHIADAFAGQMADQGIATGTQIRAWHKQLAQFLPAMRVGDHLTAVFHPREGTRFFLDGKPVGLIAGNDFCRGFFGIWLDATTTMPDLRARLLKGAG